MPVITDMSLKDFREAKRRDESSLENWEREMKRSGYLKKCKCGSAYTWQHLPDDPKMCPSCRDGEGDLVY